MTTHPTLQTARALPARPASLAQRVKLSLLGYSESSFTDPHTVVSLEEPRFDEGAYSHIGKIYEGVEPYRMGGHSVHADERLEGFQHHYDPNHRERFVVQLERRTELETLCISTRFFAGNPASDVLITLIDDLINEERLLPLPSLKPDAEHWFGDINFTATRLMFHFKAGGITRVWAFGSEAERQPPKLTWLSKNSEVLFKEDDFFGGPDFALSERADRSTPYMLGWETSRSAMGLQAVFPIEKGVVRELMIDTYRHVNNYLRSAWVLSARLPAGQVLTKADCPLWRVVSSDGQTWETDDLRSFFNERNGGGEHRAPTQLPTPLPSYSIAAIPNELWRLEATLKLDQDAMHVLRSLEFEATHICVMLLPHGGLHAIKVMGERLAYD